MTITEEHIAALRRLAQGQESVSVLEARLESLPERARLDELKASRSAEASAQLTKRASERGQRQSVDRLRQDVAKLRARERADVRSLSAEVDRERRRDLKHDLASTRQRLEELESRLEQEERMVAMFAAPEASSETNPETSPVSELDASIATARAELERAENALRADIDAARSRMSSARESLSGAPGLLEAYDLQLAEHGVGAATLKGRTCQACFMELDPMSLREIRSAGPGEIPRCPECNVLLLIVD